MGFKTISGLLIVVNWARLFRVGGWYFHIDSNSKRLITIKITLFDFEEQNG